MKDRSATSEFLAGARARFEEEFQRYIHSLRERYDYGEFFEPVFADLREFLLRKAKRVRPVLFLTSHHLLSGEAEPGRPVLRIAVALELLHAFILVHDDILDCSDLRRGLPTFHKMMEARLGNRDGNAKAGQDIGIVAGDLLFALAHDTLAEAGLDPALTLRIMRRLLGYITDTGAGAIQEILLGVRDVSMVLPEDIENMYLRKTTRYTIEAPLVLGAMAAGADTDVLDILVGFAEPAGFAFQILNDLREFEHFDMSDALFPADLLEGKKNLLLVEAFHRLGESDRGFLQLCLHSPRLNETTVLKVRELIQKSGAEPILRDRAMRLFSQAETQIAHPRLTSAQADGFTEVLRLIRRQSES
jgi:geranylgeranyl diphosphate synthase type I